MEKNWTLIESFRCPSVRLSICQYLFPQVIMMNFIEYVGLRSLGRLKIWSFQTGAVKTRPYMRHILTFANKSKPTLRWPYSTNKGKSSSNIYVYTSRAVRSIGTSLIVNCKFSVYCNFFRCSGKNYLLLTFGVSERFKMMPHLFIFIKY